MMKIELATRKNYGTKKSFWRQFEPVKKPNYSALETLFELEIKEKNRPNKISNYQ